MATLKTIAPATWINTTQTNSNYSPGLIARFNNFADSQKQNHTLWFFVVLMVHGVFFLPLPAALSFYYGAPVYFLFVTLGLFFANIITGMGGSGIRVTLGLFAASTLVHLVMLALYLI